MRLIHYFLLILFRNVSILNRLIPTLPSGRINNLKEFSSVTDQNILYTALYPSIRSRNPSLAILEETKYIYDSKRVVTTRKGNLNEIEYPEIFTCQLGETLIHLESGILINQNSKRLIVESSIWKDQFIDNLPFIDSLRARQIELISENKASTYFAGSTNFYHWLGEFAIRAWLLRKLYPDIIIYTNKHFTTWQKDMLKMLDVPIDKFVIINSYKEFIKINKFIFISFLGTPETIHSGVLQDFKRQITESIPPPCKIYPEKIYISRSKANHRQMNNEPALVPLLKQFGYTIINMEDHSLVEQYQFFRHARYIMAIHGPALTNCYLSTKATIIELFNENHIVECYAQLALSQNLCYEAILCSSIGNPTNLMGKSFYGYNSIELEESKLINALRKIHCN